MNAYEESKEFSSTKAIIAALIRLDDEWSEGRPQDDEMTFVIVNVKE